MEFNNKTIATASHAAADALLRAQDRFDADDARVAVERLALLGVDSYPPACAQLARLTSEAFACKVYGIIPQPGHAQFDASMFDGRWVVAVDGVQHQARGVSSLMSNGDSDPILGVPFFITALNRMDYQDTVAEAVWLDERLRWHKSPIQLSMLADERAVARWLYARGIFVHGELKKVAMFIRDSAARQIARREPGIVATRMGWNIDESSFLCGDSEVSVNSSRQIKVDEKIVPAELQRGLRPKGDLDAWASLTTQLAEPAFWPHAFAVLACLGTPLLKLMGVQGAVLSLAGLSGSGKSTAMYVGLSAFGRFDDLTMAPDSTFNAKMEKMRIANNIPVGIDDASGAKSVKHLPGLVYMAANGKPKDRAKQDGSLVSNDPWTTLLLVTTNNPLLDMSVEIIAEAERRRMVELNVETAIPRSYAERAFNVMQQNHGVAAPAMIQRYLANRGKIVELANNKASSIIDSGRVPSQNRFGVWLIAAAAIAGHIAYRNGVIRFDPKPVIESTIDALGVSAQEIKSVDQTIEDEIAAFLNENQARVSILNIRNWVNQDVIDRANGIVAIVKLHERRIGISIRKLEEWFASRGIPTTHFKMWRKNNGIVYDKQLLAKHGAQEYVIYVPLTPEYMSHADTSKMI